MKTYELSYIVSPELTSEEAADKARELELAITSREGLVLKQSNPVAKTLSYPIAKRASGFFGVIEFQIESEKLLELKEIIAKDGKIVRHMLIIKEAAQFKKERRTRTKAEAKVEVRAEPIAVIEDEKPAPKAEIKEKVELKDIEEELDQILGK